MKLNSALCSTSTMDQEIIRSKLLALTFTLILGCMLLVPSRVEAESNPCVLMGRNRTEAMLKAYGERMSTPRPMQFKLLKVWEKRRLEVRRDVMRCIGLDPMPERLPLNTHYGGSLDRSGYVVKRVYWQTFPNIYASGYLYLPKASGKHPAVLHPVGHWGNLIAKHPVVQSRAIVLAQRGYVGLVVDPAHCGTRVCGITTIGWETWNNIRAVDLLESLPEVDASKIGSTGASGGGYQTWFMMVADDRIKAAVPVVGTFSWRSLLLPHTTGSYWNYGVNCECNWPPGIMRYTDGPETMAVFAPRPVLYEVVPRDPTEHFPLEEYRDIKPIYNLYRAEDHVKVIQFECGHDYNKAMREEAYTWFDRWLKGIEYPNHVIEPEIKVEEPETLSALETPPPGAIMGYDGGPPAGVVDAVLKHCRSTYTFTEPQPKSVAEWKAYQQGLRKQVADLLGEVQVKGSIAKVLPSAEISGLRAERFLVRSEPEILVPVLLFRPNGSGLPPVAVLLRPEGKQSAVETSAEMVRSLVARGVAVMLPDVRLTGELSLGNWEINVKVPKGSWERHCKVWGRPEAGMALTDLRACLDALTERKDVDAGKIALVGLGKSSITALFVGALEPRFKAVFVEEAGITYRSGREDPYVQELLKVGDLPQLAAAISPRPAYIWRAGERDFDFSHKAYEEMQAPTMIRLSNSAATEREITKAVLSEILR